MSSATPTAGGPVDGVLHSASSKAIKDMKLYQRECRIYRELQARGYDVSADENLRLPVEVVSELDQLHIGGAFSVVEACQILQLGKDDRVLDIGSGYGGPARLLASLSGCAVSGVEMQAEFVKVAEDLTRRCGLEERVTSIHGDFLDLDISCSFTCMVSWLCILHIPKCRLYEVYSKAATLLRPGSRIYVEDFFLKGTMTSAEKILLKEQVQCPDLPSRDEYEEILRNANFENIKFEDVTEEFKSLTAKRFDAWAKQKEQRTKILGEDSYTDLLDFYKCVWDLFEGGKLGAVRLSARMPS